MTAGLPEPPYTAVIFSNRVRTGGGAGAGADADGGGAETAAAYAETAARMEELAEKQDGYLGRETARGPDGFAVTVSYWRDEDAVRRWRGHAEHVIAQKAGRERFYEHYTLRVARVERQYEWTRPAP